MTDYKIQGQELKTKTLFKTDKGKKAISEILSKTYERSKAMVIHKKYGLACKFFEYIFEPVLADKNSIFYQIGFHRFISNLLFIEFQCSTKYSEQIFMEFSQLMREQSDDNLHHIFGILELPELSPILDKIRSFCVSHRQIINDEIESLKGTRVGKWILDLSTTSLFSLLAEWGSVYDSIDVFCDISKPIKEQRDTFDVMIGRQDILYSETVERTIPVTFNLAREINFVESKEHFGIQLADIIAGTFAFVFEHRGRGVGNSNWEEWSQYIPNVISENSMFPDFDELDLNTLSAARNSLLLDELVRRSLDKEPLLDGIERFLRDVTRELPFYPPIANNLNQQSEF